jgi:hypothetical protein
MYRPRAALLRTWVKLGLLAVVALGPGIAWAQGVSPAGAIEPTKTEPAKAEATPDVPPPQPPADPLGAAAYRVLATHCARCHQGGQTTGPAPSAGFGNVLRLSELLSDPGLVRPGNPDGSRVYIQMLRHAMPYDAFHEAAGGSQPTPDEIAAVRDWIEKAAEPAACADRKSIIPADIDAALVKAAAAAGPAAGRLRFLSLAAPFNACASPAQMFAYRQALGLIVNGLSWKKEPVPVTAIDDQRTLYQIDLGALGWLPAHWERIERSDPNALGFLAEVSNAARAPFATEHPIARAEWFAETALRAPLYYDLLGLPGLTSEIGRILHLDVEREWATTAVTSETIEKSRFARGARVIERLKPVTPMFWSTIDSVVSNGKGTADAAPSPAQHAAGLALFALPNGLPAFFIRNSKGERIDRVPAGIAQGRIAGDTPLAAGIACLACHTGGPVRPGDPQGPESELDRRVASDRSAIAAAHETAALVAGFAPDGVPPVAALARDFTRAVGRARAVAELGVTDDQLTLLGDRAGPAAVLARRLVLGTVPRAEFDAGFPVLLAALRAPVQSTPLATPGAPTPATRDAPVAIPAETHDHGPRISLLSDKLTYKPGDALRLTVSASADCYMTIVSIDQRGRGTVIYPSDFEPANLLLAGREIRLPADGAPYLFRLKESGRERVVAICSTAASTVDGIRHEFERQRFTDLGDYAAFLLQASKSTAAAATAADTPLPPRAPAPRVEPKGKGRARATAGREELKSPLKAGPGQITQTAITIDIR